MDGRKNRKKFYIALAICISIIVVIIDIAFIIIPDRVSSETENRNLQQFPKLTFSTLTSGRFESQFDEYIADQFPFRNAWTGTASFISRLGGKTESNGVLLGKKGYLIQEFHWPEEEEYKNILTQFSQVASVRNDINIYAIVAPTAAGVLKDHLPANALGSVCDDEYAYIDTLCSDIGSMGIKTVDVRDAISAEAASGVQVYYRTDHHWTTDAALAAYRCFAGEAHLQDSTQDLQRLPVTDSFQGTLSASSGFRMDQKDTIYVYLPPEGTGTEYVMTDMDTGEKSSSLFFTAFLETRDKYALFMGGNHGELKIQTAADSERNILVIKDSYANCFIPFMVKDFRNITVIDLRYYQGDIEQACADQDLTDILFLYNAETL